MVLRFRVPAASALRIHTRTWQHAELVRLLLSYKAEVDAPYEDGTTAFWHACAE
jgi:hypothetical protein